MEIRSTGDTVIDAAPKRFSETPEEENRGIFVDSSYKAPLIFGKDNALAQTLIYGHQLSPENQPSTYISSEKEQEIVREALAKLNIRVPQM